MLHSVDTDRSGSYHSSHRKREFPMMIITRSFSGDYNLRAKNVPAEELIPELVRALDMVCKDKARTQKQRDEIFGHVIKLMQLCSKDASLLPDTN